MRLKQLMTFRYWKNAVKTIFDDPLESFKQDSKPTLTPKANSVGNTLYGESDTKSAIVKRAWIKPQCRQVGGDHYAAKQIQPIDYILANGLDFCEGNVVKYITRWREKGTPVEDLEKIKHYVDFILEDWSKNERNA